MLYDYNTSSMQVTVHFANHYIHCYKTRLSCRHDILCDDKTVIVKYDFVS